MVRQLHKHVHGQRISTCTPHQLFDAHLCLTDACLSLPCTLQLHIGTLKGDNYSLWKDNMGLLLEDYSLPSPPAALPGPRPAAGAHQGRQHVAAHQQQQVEEHEEEEEEEAQQEESWDECDADQDMEAEEAEEEEEESDSFCHDNQGGFGEFEDEEEDEEFEEEEVERGRR